AATALVATAPAITSCSFFGPFRLFNDTRRDGWLWRNHAIPADMKGKVPPNLAVPRPGFHH
ncbi:hypothetical protein, partial [Mesorhizobium tianshanense]|uniref:hypothetical protein n=1 Tax=Mesorhizobium tianshanense TaxID=39844 RepID=UPI0024E13EEE